MSFEKFPTQMEDRPMSTALKHNNLLTISSWFIDYQSATSSPERYSTKVAADRAVVELSSI